MNWTSANWRRQAGFTAIEVAASVLFISVLIAVLVNRILPHVQKQIDILAALDQIRQLQKQAMLHYLDKNAAPDATTVNALFGDGDEGKSIAGKFRIFRVFNDHYPPQQAINGYRPENYIICSTYPLPGAAYVYALDDVPPQVAAAGTDPVGERRCGTDIGLADAE
jgi:type II secretory pathway pseudopilin PulG